VKDHLTIPANDRVEEGATVTEMRIGYLRMICDGDPFGHVELAELAKSAGLIFEYPRFGNLRESEGVKRGWAFSRQLVDEADAFILDGLPLEGDPELAGRFHDRISSGARALIFPYHGNREGLRWWTDFLERYYIRPSLVKLVGAKGERAGLIFRREENCLRNPELFAGVVTVIAESPFALWYGGEAWAVLVGSPEHWGVEASTDLPDDWNGREMACMAVWHGEMGERC
jgi:hypothetical protein